MTYLIRAFACLMIGISALAMAGEHPMPDLNLKAREARGEAAVQALGKDLESVARHYGTDAASLKKLFRKDESARIDRKGRIFYAEEAPSLEGYFDQAPSPTADTIPAAETLKLHSRPSASGKIFLNFQGRTVTDSMWNTNGPIKASPYSRDSDPAFSAQELRDIREVWLTVAEDFAPFNIDVTTEIPLNMPQSKSIEILLTNSWEWYGAVGGVCYLNSYTWDGQDRVCWVFANLQGIQNVAEATSHEIGHAMGLYHWGYTNPEGTGGSSYYWGNSNWAPIMGAAYNARYATWSKGEYTGSGVTVSGAGQNDLAIIASKTGYVLDSAGGELASAGVLKSSLQNGLVQVNHASEISDELDVDIYRIESGAGSLNLTVSPAAYDANLDLKVSLLYSNGDELLSLNHDLITSEILSIPNLSAGVYYLKIEGVGFSNPYSDGYSAYGSRGRYTVLGSYVSSGSVGPSPTPQPTVTPVPTATPVPTVTPTVTPTPSPDPNPNLSPSTQIISPMSGDSITIGSSLHVSIQSSDDRGLKGAVIYLNGKAKCRFTYSGQVNVASSCSIPVRGKAGVQWRLRSVATDLQGLEAASGEILLNVVK